MGLTEIPLLKPSTYRFCSAITMWVITKTKAYIKFAQHSLFSPISQNIKEIFAKLAKDDKRNVRFISDDHKQFCDIFIS